MPWNRDAQINIFILGFLWAIGITTDLMLRGGVLMFYASLLGLFCTLWMVVQMRWPRAALVILIAGFLLGMGRSIWAMDFEIRREKDQLPMTEYQVRVVSLVERAGVEQKFWGELVDGRALVQLKVMDERKITFGESWLIKAELIGNGAELNQKWQYRLLKDNVVWTVGQARLERKIVDGGFSVEKMVFDLRENLLGILQRNLKEPAASLAGGILIGQRATIAADILKDFQTVGLTHILAISGFNITLIINLLIYFLAKMGRWWRLVLAIILIGLFVILTGASASVVRAAVMGILIFGVKILRRRTAVFKAITLSTFLIVWFKPLYWNYDLSFQLSLFATLSLVWFGDIILEGVDLPWPEMIKEGIFLTLAAQVMTLPLMFYSFGRVSLIAPIANLLVGPLVPIAMLVSSVVLGAGVLGIGFWLSGFVEFIFQIMLGIAHNLAILPLAQVEIGQDNLWLALAWYLGIFIVFRKRKLGRS